MLEQLGARVMASEPVSTLPFASQTLRVAFDDLQRSDHESAELLCELLRGRVAPACVFIWVFRAPQRTTARSRASSTRSRRRRSLARAARRQLVRGLARATLRDHRRADECSTARGVEHYAAAVRYRVGKLLQGEQGTRLVAQARGSASALGIRDPERMFRALVTGFPD